MTEAMVRECPKCKNRFFKTDGCNLMRCTCKATMCYLCRKLVPDNYKHFYGRNKILVYREWITYVAEDLIIVYISELFHIFLCRKLVPDNYKHFYHLEISS